jgi:hypothetical protein
VQEAFIGNLLRRKLIAATDALPTARRPGAPIFGLYLPDGERQELSLLFVEYLLRKRGFLTLYLGGDVSVSDLVDVVSCTRVDYLFTLFSNAFVHEPVDRHVDNVLKGCPDLTLLLSGYQATMHDFSGEDRVRVVNGLEDMLEFVSGLNKK